MFLKIKDSFDLIIEDYLPYPNYLTIEGRPVIFWADGKYLQEAGADWTLARDMLEWARQRVNAAGYGDPYFVAIGSMREKNDEIGYDAWTKYALNPETSFEMVRQGEVGIGPVRTYAQHTDGEN